MIISKSISALNTIQSLEKQNETPLKSTTKAHSDISHLSILNYCLDIIPINKKKVTGIRSHFSEVRLSI